MLDCVRFSPLSLSLSFLIRLFANYNMYRRGVETFKNPIQLVRPLSVNLNRVGFFVENNVSIIRFSFFLLFSIEIRSNFK